MIEFANPKKATNPEDDFIVTITGNLIQVEHPEFKVQRILLENVKEIKFINTDQGPWSPDVWLALLGDQDGCLIPQGANGFDEVYEIVSKFEGFNFENANKSMACPDNKEFFLWAKK